MCLLDTFGGINDNGIKNLNLFKLYASWNSKIINVNHMNNLQILYECGNCGINDEGVKDLNLIELNSNGNHKINQNHKAKIAFENKPINININTSYGRKIELFLSNNGKIKQIKYMLQDILGVPANQQTLIFAGKQLSNKLKLNDYNLQNDTTLHLIFGLKGD